MLLGFLSGVPACEAFSGESIGEAYYVVGIGQTWAYSTRSRGVVSANYRPLLGVDLPTCPPSVAIGDNCRFSSCRYDPSQLPTPVSAGTISVSGLEEDVVLEPREEPYNGSLYAPEERDVALFEEGATVHFEIAGLGEIPPASVDLVAPAFVSVTEPVLPEPEESEEGEEEEGEESEESEAVTPKLAVDRSSDLEVAWEPVSGGEPVIVTVSVRHEEDPDNIVDYAYSCSFDGALGEGTLSHEYLERLPASSDAGAATLYVGRDETTEVYGRWEHWFAVSSLESFPVELE